MTVQQIEKVETGVLIDGSVTNVVDFDIQIVKYAMSLGLEVEGWDAMHRDLTRNSDDSEHLYALEWESARAVDYLNEHALEGFVYSVEESQLRLDSLWVEIVTVGQWGHDEVIDILHNVEGVIWHGPDEASKEAAVAYLSQWDYGNESEHMNSFQSGEPRDEWEHGEVVGDTYLLCWADGMVGLYRKPLADAWASLLLG